MLSNFFTAFLGFGILARAAVIQNNPAIPKDYGLYGTYSVKESNISFTIHAQGYTGESLFTEIDLSNFVKPHSFTPISATALSSRGDDFALQERDICGFFSGCYQTAVDSATTGAIYLANTGSATAQAIYVAVLNYWTANNYANTNAVLQNAIVGLVINIASTPIGNAIINSESGTTGGNDGCNVASAPQTAEYFASSLYDFCSAIQAARSTTTNTDFYQGEFSNSNGDVADGKVAVTRNFIAAQGGNFGPTCSALGITWKRAIQSLGLGAK